MSEERKVGRPPLFESAEQMQVLIDKYFEECDGKILLDKDGEPVRNKYGKIIRDDRKPYTVTGLALALGFTTRQALLNYEGKQEFVDTIKRAKARVEKYAEERLYDKDGSNGAKFSLANNFKGWTEKQQIEADVKNTMNITV
jgi:hypothetical protein